MGVTGDLRGTKTGFSDNQPGGQEEQPRQQPRQVVMDNNTHVIYLYFCLKRKAQVSIFGNLCRGDCNAARDGRHYCAVQGGASEECGPRPGTTPRGQHCADQCRKRGDSYFW